MKIEITGHQVEIGQPFHDYIQDKLDSGIKNFFKDVISAHVIIGRSGSFFSAEIVINAGMKHRTANAESAEADVYLAFDEALKKIKTQLSKHKEQALEARRKNRKIAAKEGEEGL